MHANRKQAMKKSVFALIALGIVGSVAVANADAHADAVAMRQALMKSVGGQTKILGDMAKGVTPFDAIAATAAAETLAAAAKEIPVKFETKSLEGETEALPIIWEQFDDFTAKAGAMGAAASATAGVADQAALGAAMGNLGKACGACHETYRVKK